MFRFVVLLLICLTGHQAAATNNNGIFANKIVNIRSGGILLENNASLPINPASTLKVLTFYLARKNLGKDFKYKTEVLTSSRNLYIRFSGDPTLTMQDLDVLLEIALKRGTSFDAVYLDGDIFGHELYAPGSSTDNLKFYYSSPISAFSIDKNYAPFVQSKAGGLSYDNTAKFNLLKLRSKAVLAKDLSICPLELFNTGPNEYSLDGCYDNAAIPPKLSIAVTDPKKYARDAIAASLKKHNIAVGKIEFGKVNDKAVLKAEHKSQELSFLLKEMLHKSDNHIADSLVKIMTYQHFKKPASWFLVEKFLKEAVEKDLGVDTEQLRIMDGSGLSKKNYITANFMISLLEHIYKDKAARELFLESTPSFGSADSTLKNRLANLPGKVYAKTGTLENVSSLAGIFLGDNGKTYAFALFANNFLGLRNKEELEEALLEEVFASAH